MLFRSPLLRTRNCKSIDAEDVGSLSVWFVYLHLNTQFRNCLKACRRRIYEDLVYAVMNTQETTNQKRTAPLVFWASANIHIKNDNKIDIQRSFGVKRQHDFFSWWSTSQSPAFLHCASSQDSILYASGRISPLWSHWPQDDWDTPQYC